MKGLWVELYQWWYKGESHQGTTGTLTSGQRGILEVVGQRGILPVMGQGGILAAVGQGENLTTGGTKGVLLVGTGVDQNQLMMKQRGEPYQKH